MLTFKKRLAKIHLAPERTRAKQGDTLVEVALAIGILGFTVAAVITTMNATLSASQTNLEETMARNEIDIQAEALRYIHNAYMAQRDFTSADKEYDLLWRAILAQAVEPEAIPELADVTSCNEYYPQDTASATGDIRNLYQSDAFIINTHRLNTQYATNTSLTDSIILPAKTDTMPPTNSKFQPATIYPRIIYGIADTDDTLSSKPVSTDDDFADSNLYRAEGIWIQAACGDNFNNCKSQNSGDKPSYYDFYIRSCWESPSSSGNSVNTIGTIVRLHNPDTYQAATTTTPTTADLSLTYYLSNGTTLMTDEVTNASSYSFTAQSANIIHPSSLQTENPDGWTFVGWCASTSPTCDNPSTSRIYRPGNSITLSASRPHLYMIAVYEHSYSIDYVTTVSGVSNMPTIQSGLCYSTAVAAGRSTCTQTLSLRMPIASGRTFSSWSDGSHNYASGVDVTLGPSQMDLVLTAQWSVAYLQFNKNAGVDTVTNMPSTLSCNESISTGCTVTVPSTIPVRDGYVFAGWSDSATGNIICGRSSTCNINLSNKSDEIGSSHIITLYAIWYSAYLQDMSKSFCRSAAFDNNRKITLTDRRDGKQYLVKRAASGDCWMAQNFAYDSGYLRTGSHINASSNSQGNYYTSSQAIKACQGIGGSWDLPKYNGNSSYFTYPGLWGYVANGTLYSLGERGGLWVAPLPGVSWHSLYFVNTSLADRGYISAAHNNPNTGLNAQCYFSTQKTTAYLQFNQNADDSTILGMPATQSCTYDAKSSCTVTVPNTIPTRTGYNFIGWSYYASGDVICSRGSTCNITLSDATEQMDKNYTVTLYAIWRDAYLQFNKNAGSDSVTNMPSAQFCTGSTGSGCTFTVPNTIPTRTGYTFVGWSYSASGSVICRRGYTCTIASSSGASSTDGSSIVTLYAIWSNAYLQDMTRSFCLSAIFDDGQRIPLIDRRDGKQYFVQRVANGDCWMAQNLAYDLDSLYIGYHQDASYASQGDYYTSSQAIRACSNIGNGWKLPAYEGNSGYFTFSGFWGYVANGTLYSLDERGGLWTTPPPIYSWYYLYWENPNLSDGGNISAAADSSYTGLNVQCYFPT